MKHKYLLISILVTVLLGAGGFAIWKAQKADDRPSVQGVAVSAPEIGLRIEREPTLSEKPVSPGSDGQKGQLWAFEQPQGSQQQFVISSAYEQGASIKKLTAYTKKSIREAVTENVNLQLPQQYPAYEELSQRNLQVNGIEATETIFEYTNSGVRVKQRLLLLFKNSDTAVYIRAQAKADEYDVVNTKYFEPLFQSIRFE